MRRLLFIAVAVGIALMNSGLAWAENDIKMETHGEIFLAGMCVDNIYLDKTKGSQSSSLYYQRIRLMPVFKLSPDIELDTSVDIAKRAWGANTRSSDPDAQDPTANYSMSEGENIGINIALLHWKTPYGKLTAGMDAGSTFGTKFGNNGEEVGDYIIKWSGKFKGALAPWVYTLKYYKYKENSYTTKNSDSTYNDADQDKYLIGGGRPWKGGGFGFYLNYSTDKSGTMNEENPYERNIYSFCPYIRHKFNEVFYVESEAKYQKGKYRDYRSPSTRTSLDYETLAFYLKGRADVGKWYAEGIFAYISGDDPETTDKIEASGGAGTDWNPLIVLWNFDRYVWQGPITGGGSSVNDDVMKNAHFYQLRVGMKPTEKLDVMATVAYATADQKPSGYIGDEYGIEIDLHATYQINKNFSYWAGAGYLMTGDYFKGDDENAELRDEMVLMHKLVYAF